MDELSGARLGVFIKARRYRSRLAVNAAPSQDRTETALRVGVTAVLFSGGLPIRQNRQLPKARHGAGARPVQRKARKMFY